MREPREIAAIVLAAGASCRFGSDKLSYPVTLEGATLPIAAHSLLPWLETFNCVTVVVRRGSGAFRQVIETALGLKQPGRIRWVECADAARGMAFSLACGVRANPNAAGWLIGLADMPLLPKDAVAGVRAALSSGAALAVPTSGGAWGHPVGFSSGYREELLTLQGDGGARPLIERDAGKVMQVKIGDAGIFLDIDFPGDLRKV